MAGCDVESAGKKSETSVNQGSFLDKIVKIITVPTQGAYYYEDVEHLQKHPTPESDRAFTPSTNSSFTFVRELAETVSVGVESESGVISWGECVGVSYAAKSGRHPTFRHGIGIREVEEGIEERLLQRDITSFKELSNLVPRDLHPAVQYGVSQALLNLLADTKRRTPCEVICEEWGLPLPTTPVPLQGSSGNERKRNAEKMILNRLEALPHSQIDDIPSQLGVEGELLLEYVTWLRERIVKDGGGDYQPIIHLDVHGAIGEIFKRDPERIAKYLTALEERARPFRLRLESVVLGARRDETVSLLLALKRALAKIGSSVALVVDEWANTLDDIRVFALAKACDMVHIKMPDMGNLATTIDAVLECKDLGLLTLLGGSCVETDLSSRLSTHVALATRPDLFLAKPGMGIDEAIMICRNEMRRTLARISR